MFSQIFSVNVRVLSVNGKTVGKSIDFYLSINDWKCIPLQQQEECKRILHLVRGVNRWNGPGCKSIIQLTVI